MKCLYVNMKQWAIIAIVCLFLCWFLDHYYFPNLPPWFLMLLFGSACEGTLVGISCFCIGLWTGIPMTKIGFERMIGSVIIRMFTTKK